MDQQRLLALVGIAALSFVLSFVGATIGFVLGHFRLPLLIAYLGSATAGAATNLTISGLGALGSTYRHAREGRVSLPAFLLMGVPSALGAIVGVELLLKVSRLWAHLIIGALVLVAGVQMAFGRPVEPTPGEQRMPRGLRLVVEIAIGLILGIMASVTGLMLNTLRLPMMVRLLKLDVRVAVGTNMAIGCLTAITGSLAAWRRSAGVDLLVLVAVGLPTLLGGYLGARWTGWLKKETMQRVVGSAVAVMGLFMAAQGLQRETRARDFQTVAEEKDREPEFPEGWDWWEEEDPEDESSG